MKLSASVDKFWDATPAGEHEAYFVYTSTPLKSSEEATLELADQIQIDGVYGLDWFTVVRVKKHSITSNGSQYEAIVIKNPKV